MSGDVILKVENLKISFRFSGRVSTPVRGVSFEIPRASRVALVGESGCGKSLTVLQLSGLVQRAEVSGRVSGTKKIAYVFQNPMQSLDPVFKVGEQIAEGTEKSRAEVGKLLEAVGLERSAAGKYPCELSGGQRQRVMIAMALAQDPELIVADEPTTALDVTTQKEVLELIERVAAERGMSVLLITHNLALVAAYSRYVHVMYAGEIVEHGPVEKVLRHARHPYTRGLLAAVPRLDLPRDSRLTDIPGAVPSPWAWPEGCAFHPRCPKARPSCRAPGFVRCPELDEDEEGPRRG
jgi:oligopeptide/dipeptide ABC transporter ATP-binding protein